MSHPRLLLVDDEPVFRRSLAEHLRIKRQFLEVVTAETAEDALSVLRSEKIDVLIADVEMPGLDGLALVQILEQESIQVEVILLSAYREDRAREQALPAGALTILDKPLDMQQLLRCVDQATAPDSGELRGISIAGFLQLIQMEGKSCRVLVRAKDRSGHLDFDRGILIGAVHEQLAGDQAALRIIGWKQAEISLESSPANKVFNLKTTLDHLLTEAKRLDDAGGDAASESRSDEGDQEMAAFVRAATESSDRVPLLPPELVQGAHLDRLEAERGFLAAAIIHPLHEKPAYSVGRVGDLLPSEAARSFLETTALEANVLKRAGSAGLIGQMSIKTRSHHHLLHDLGPVGWLYALFEAQGINLALAMRELEIIAHICRGKRTP